MPGCAPGGAPSFLVSPRKEGKRKRPRCLRPRRAAPGQPAVLGAGGVSLELAPAALKQSRALVRHPLRSSAQPEGGEAHTGHRCARPRVGGRAQRWPESFPPSIWLRRGAQGAGWRVCRRTHTLRCLARRGCPSGARQRAASSTAHPVTAHRRLPEAKRRDAGCGAPFFWVLFFGEAKKSTSPAGASPGLRLQSKEHSACPSPQKWTRLDSHA